jgi:exodeoxyribonuclease VII small subunit
MSQAPDPKDLSYEEAFHELQSIVEALEDSDHSLDESLTLYERGQALAARCNALLDGAELRLSQLIQDEEGGYREVEFEPPAGDEA